MNELALFAGAGGGILGGNLIGWRTVCAVEIEPYPRNILLARQDDGTLPPFPVWDDVTTFDGRPWRGVIDVVSGGFPCQDISSAGSGAGIEGPRSGLWREMARIIHEVRPRYAFVENSPMLTTRGLGRVLGDLAEMGYNAAWGVLGASDMGAPHIRKRIWILANTDGSQRQGADAFSVEYPAKESGTRGACRSRKAGGGCWEAEPDVGRVADGVAARVDRLKALGNGQVPCVAAAMFEHLRGILEERKR